jgi:hypothetical protein
MLSTYTYTVPSGHTQVYLEKRGTPGEVDVFLDAHTGSPIYTFTDVHGNDVIDWASASNYTTFDQVTAAYKPYGNSDSGIKVQGGSGGAGVRTLEIDCGPTDQLIQTTSSSTITVTDTVSQGPTLTLIGNDFVGTGVTHVKLVLHDDGYAEVDVGTVAVQTWSTPLYIEAGSGTNDFVTLGGYENTSVSNVTVHAIAGYNVVQVNQDGDADGTTSAIVDLAGSGNELHIGDPTQALLGLNCTATLANAAGTSSHDIEIETVTVTLTGKLVVDHEASLGDVYVDSYSEADIESPLTVAATGSASGTFTNDGKVEFIGGSAPSTVHKFALTGDDPESSSSEVDVDSSANLTIETSSALGALNAPGTGVIILAARVGSYATTAASVLAVKSLDLGTGPTGKLDINDNDLVIDYSGSTPIGSWNGSAYDGVAGLIVSGRNGGHWGGAGITSSKGIDNSAYYLIGVAEATQAELGSGNTFDARTVDSDAVLVKFTYGGDASLDGRINSLDYSFGANYGIDNGVAGSLTMWVNGDFNSDGKINISDYAAIIDSNINTQGARL